MAKLTLEELRKLREKRQKELSRRESNKSREVIIGMGTCGIAAGAKDVFDAFLDESEKQGLSDVVIKQTGCMGLCYSEPTVEVRMEGMPDVVYGKVDSATARKIVQKHLMNKTLVNDHIFDKPAADIIGQE